MFYDKKETSEAKVPKAWTKLEAKTRTKVEARIDMSAEVAGAGLCPDCRKPMDRAWTNGIDCYVCHADRIAIPVPDSEARSHKEDTGFATAQAFSRMGS